MIGLDTKNNVKVKFFVLVVFWWIIIFMFFEVFLVCDNFYRGIYDREE